MIEEKYCRKCDTVKPIGEFGVNRASRDGHTTYCRECNNTTSRAFHHANQETEVARNKAWRDLNRDILKDYREDRKERYPDHVANNRIFWKSGGLTLEGYHEWLAAQGDVCGVCGTMDPGGRSGEWFQIDHDHDCCKTQNSCGKCFRGILCNRCNTWVIPVYEGKREGSIDELWVFAKAYIDDYTERRAVIDASEEVA